MSLELPLKAELDEIVKNKNRQLPLAVGQAKEVTEAVEPLIENMNLDKSERRRLNAKIFQYLTAGAGNNTHVSGTREGDLKTFSKPKTRDRLQKNRVRF